jgi:AcrR family transcriptional regulator
MSRSYDSSGRSARAKASRLRILEAARTQFAARGIDQVTITEVARAAEVGVSSVYAAFESKAGILRELMKEVLFGPSYQRALGDRDEGLDPVELVLRSAALARAIYQSEDEVLGLVRGASSFSPELRSIEEEFEELRYRMQAARVRALEAAGHLAPGLTLEEARRILWALTHREIYRSLVTVGGWSAARYERWLADLIRSQLVSPRRPGRSRKGASMPQRRVVPPAPPPKGGKLKGPASYFPNIEKTYGQPIQHWLDLTVTLLDDHAHMEAVGVLKGEHGLGHGHANAIVAYVKASLAKS